MDFLGGGDKLLVIQIFRNKILGEFKASDRIAFKFSRFIAVFFLDFKFTGNMACRIFLF